MFGGVQSEFGCILFLWAMEEVEERKRESLKVKKGEMKRFYN